MKSINGQLSIHTGETFTIDFSFINSDGSPYIISSLLTNPYFLITVSSDRYDNKNSYLLNYWNRITYLPRFEQTDCVLIASAASSLPAGYEDVGTFIQNDVTYYYAKKAVFYYKDSNDEYHYVYWLYNQNPESAEQNPYAGQWVNYTLRIVKTFQQNVTKQWTNGTYYYSITIVSGEETIEYLKSLCDANNITYDENSTILELYNLLLESGYIFDNDFNISRPVTNYDAVLPLLSATSFIVLASLNGDI